MAAKKSVLKNKLTRRDFIKKAAAGAIGLGALAWGANHTILQKISDAPKSISVPFKNAAPKTLWKWSKEASYWERSGDVIECGLCPHRCVLAEGDRGACRARANVGGKLYTLTYGNPCSANVDTIEKKPLYHFLPGTKAYSIATAGCNLRCKFCQNWEISQTTPEKLRNYDLMPSDLVAAVGKARARDALVRSIAYTYSEPAAFYDYMLDSAKLARAEGIRSVVITAGYIKPKPLRELGRNVEAIKIDLKGFNERFYRDVCGAELDGVLNAIKVVGKQKGVWMEIVNLVVPTLNDDMEEIAAMCEWLVKNTGPDVPLHFSRFQPQYKLRYLPPTPPSTLIKARETALKAGVNHVFIGNIPTPYGNNTYCPGDGTLCIERKGFMVTWNRLVDGKCPTCGKRIAGVWT